MRRITIEIPDDVSEERVADIAGFLQSQAEQLTQSRAAIDDDPEVRAEVTDKIKRAMADIQAGRFVDGREAMQRIAEKHGLTLPE
ncbi:MAG: hypothetical protein AAGB26_14565 [Planctomycetota bacterium]